MRELINIVEDMQRQKPKLPDAFWSWFGNSVVRDANGDPLVLYHGTAADISEFRKIVWGSVGTDLAFDYAMMRDANYEQGASANILPLYMKIERPFDADLGLSKTVTVGEFTMAIVEQGMEHGVALNDEVRERGKELIGIIKDGRYEEESGPHYDRHDFWLQPVSLFGMKGAQAIMDLFKLFGFDGIKMIEGGHLTYGAFSSQQVKSIFNQGAYNPEDPRISEGR